MKVNVRLFAIAKDAMGDGEVEIELNDGATVADVRSVLLKRLPELNSMSSLLRFAVNEGYADDGTVVQSTDEIACIPPVSGG